MMDRFWVSEERILSKASLGGSSALARYMSVGLEAQAKHPPFELHVVLRCVLIITFVFSQCTCILSSNLLVLAPNDGANDL